MQSVTAASRDGIVYRQAKGIAAKEPLEGLIGSVIPIQVFGCMVGVKTGGDQRIDLHWLLVEICDFLSLLVKAHTANGHDPTPIGLLNLYQPFQRIQANLNSFFFAGRLSIAEQGLR